MKKEQRKLKKTLALFFWANLILCVAIALFLVYEVGVDGKSVSKNDFMWERFAIILTVGVIPLSLKIFHSQHKKIIRDDLPLFLGKLKNIFCLRILALDIVVILNFVGFYYIGALNFIYMASIAIFVFLMCYPTDSMIDPVLEKITTNDDNN